MSDPFDNPPKRPIPEIPRRNVRAASRCPMALVLLYVIVPANSLAQVQPPERNAWYVGATMGAYFDAWEGMSGRAAASSVMLGHDFNPRWGLRGEVGGTGDVCDRRDVPPELPERTGCHRDGVLNLSLVRRFAAGPGDLSVLLGPLIPHVGFGTQVPIGPALAVAAEFDAVYSISAIAAHPKVALTWHF